MFADGFDLFLLAAYVLCSFELYAMEFLSVSTVFPEIVHFLALEATVLLFLEFFDVFSEIGGDFCGFFEYVCDAVELSFDEFVDVFS